VAPKFFRCRVVTESIPPCWSMSRHSYVIMSFPCSGAYTRDIVPALGDSLPPSPCHRVQHEWLYQVFAAQVNLCRDKAMMRGEGGRVTKLLWHGTGRVNPVIVSRSWFAPWKVRALDDEVLYRPEASPTCHGVIVLTGTAGKLLRGGRVFC